jgi:flagellar FliL protein
MSNTASAPNAAPKKSRRGLMLVATAAIVVLLGGGGTAYWMFARGSEKAAPVEEEKAGPGAVVPMDAFIVNLADPGARRFLRVTLSLVVEDDEHALEINENEVVKMRVRSAILELLAVQNADLLITPEGKAELKKAIAEGASMAVEGLHITDVLFSEFVVQF